MPASEQKPRRWAKHPAVRIFFAVGLLAVLNFVTATGLMWKHYDELAEHLQNGTWPFEDGAREIRIEQREADKVKTYRVSLFHDADTSGVEFELSGQDFTPLRVWENAGLLQLVSVPKALGFSGNGADVTEIRDAVREAAGALPKVALRERLLALMVLRPFVTGVQWTGRGFAMRIHTSRGTLWLGSDALPLEADLQVGQWSAKISPHHRSDIASAGKMLPVPGLELAASVAEAIRVVKTLVVPAPQKPDEIRKSGAGWMVVRDGHSQVHLSGTPYEIGHQHGSLAPEDVKHLCRRLVYGVGLLYSLKKGEWFPQAARNLVERQRRFIAPAYFEEMKGLADGAGVPLDLVQMANIFPEFFHCSGAALMGDATAGGELLHARVLDYMVGIGLQDHAAVIAIERPAANRFVTVGYLGFIGSVTGMNEKQVAIGEMGGDGVGDWDGIPMSLLIRQALETCDTLAEVETFMRESPRTCEYYYLISDGKGPTAMGVAATPEKFETFGPGEWHERLTQPVGDAVLLSGPGRYEALVERVKQRYGKITSEELAEIIKRPVAMKSNLHNVIFRPQFLRLSVADATQHGLACDQPYRTYSWDALFSAAPSR